MEMLTQISSQNFLWNFTGISDHLQDIEVQDVKIKQRKQKHKENKKASKQTC